MTATSEARVVVADYQRGTPGHINATNDLLTATMDHIVANFLGASTRYAGMVVAADVSNKRVVVAAGTLYAGGPGYALQAAFTVDLSGECAKVPADKSALVAILAAGYEDAEGEKFSATFLDPAKKPANPRDPWPTIEVVTATRKIRYVQISAPAGAADVQPGMPNYGPSLCLVATVRINRDGIVAISQNEATRIETLEDVAEQTEELTAKLSRLDPQILALLSSVSGLALSIAGLQALFAEIAKLQAQLNALQQQANNQGSQQQTGSAPTLSGYDLFLDLTKTDTAMTGNGAIVKDGLRFPTAAQDDKPLAPQNPFSADLTLIGSRHLTPKFTRGFAANNNNFGPVFGASQLGVVTLTATYRGFGVSRTRWDPTLQDTSVAQLLLNGDPNQIFASDPSDLNYDQAWGNWRSPTTELTRRAGYAKDLTGREYWSRVTGAETFNGYRVIAQPYVSSSDEMITGFAPMPPDLRSSQLGASAVLLLMGDVSGSPDPSRTYGKAAWVAAETGTGRIDTPNFTFDMPVLKRAGEVMWLVLLTPPDGVDKYFLMGVDNTPNFGTAKTFNNGYWMPVSRVPAISGALFRASFAGSGVLRVPMQPLQLAGGMDAIDLVAPAIVPPGCSIDYEVQIGGVGVPVSEIKSGSHPLLARPSNLPLTMLVTYTESAAPIIDLTGGIAVQYMAGARSEVSRASLTLHHVSDVRVPPANVTKIVETVQLDAFRTDTHTFGAKLLTGPSYATQTVPTDVKDVVQTDGSLKRTFIWTLSAGVLGHKVALDGVTSDAAKPFSGRRADWTAAP